MCVILKFFARLREIYGPEIMIPELGSETLLIDTLRNIGLSKREGYEILFDETRALRNFIVVMHNGKRLSPAEIEATKLTDGDQVLVFSPVAGG